MKLEVVIVSMAADPLPDDCISLIQTNRTVAQADTDRID